MTSARPATPPRSRPEPQPWGLNGDKELLRELLPTPFVASWIHRGRGGDLRDPDPARRAQAWAGWAVSQFVRMSGVSERPYVAIALPGRFYDPGGRGPSVRPHVEMPASVLSRPDPEFPDRLAMAGNGLLFDWWVLGEVTAVRRSLFTSGRAGCGSAAAAVDLLGSHRAALAQAVADFTVALTPAWERIEELLLTHPAAVSQEVTRAATTEELAALLPAAASLELRMAFDRKLLESSRDRAARRVGVWQISGAGGFVLPALTPRLTRRSVFTDPQFTPAQEGAAALLARAVVLRRLLLAHAPTASSARLQVIAAPARTGGPFLRAVVAQVGAKIPEASLEGAVHFLHSYPQPEQAWAALTRWAGDSYMLTVTEGAFTAACVEALRCLRRAEDPSREAINTLLPVAWDTRGRVVRVTFSRPVDAAHS